MEWRDQGILLSVRRHGESAAIAEVFTPGHGRHAGVVRGGTSRKLAPVLQPGAQLDITWKARLQEHMGGFAVEPLRSRSAQVMGDRMALAGLNTVTALLCFSLPEREPHPALYQRTEALLDLLGQSEIWPLAYLHWEVALLEDLGFGLDLSKCAATGVTDDLIYVSPRTGRAVSRAAGAPYADKMLALPPFMLGAQAGVDEGDVKAGFDLTGHFLEQFVFHPQNRPLPPARVWMLDKLGEAGRL